MKIICVGGASSNCGKTAVGVLLSKVFPGWAAVKVTPSRPDAICAHGNDCGACMAPDGPYEIIRDHGILAAPGKDTAHFLNAGVARVLWIRSLPKFLPAALDTALAELSGAPGVIVESTTAISFLDGLNILTVQEGGDELKESARRCLSRVDLVALNVTTDEAFPEHHRVGKLKPFLSQPARIIPMCAMLAPEAPVNRAFVEACLSAVNAAV